MDKFLFFLSCKVNYENLYLQKVLAKAIITTPREIILKFIESIGDSRISRVSNDDEMYSVVLLLSKFHLKNLDVPGNLVAKYELLTNIDNDIVRELVSDYVNIEPDYLEMKYAVDELNRFIETYDIRSELTDISEKLISFLTSQTKSSAVDDIIKFLGSKYLSITSRYIESSSKNEQIIVDKDSEVIEKFSSLIQKKSVYSTGYESLDKLLGNGFESSRVYVFAGKPGHGKSALLLNFAHNIQKKSGKYVVYITLENDELETIQRLCKIVLFDKLEVDKVDDHYARTFLKDQSDRHAYSHVVNKYLKDEKIIIKYFPPKTQMNIIFSWLMSLKTEIDYCAVCLDYASLVKSSKEYGEMRFELGQVILDLKQMSRELSIPVITAVQLNTAGYDSIPTMRNLDESRQIAQNADFIGLLYDAKDASTNTFTYLYSNNHAKIGINVDKNRNGPRSKLLFSFFYDYLKFLDEMEVDRRENEAKEEYISKLDEIENYGDEEELLDVIGSQISTNSTIGNAVPSNISSYTTPSDVEINGLPF